MTDRSELALQLAAAVAGAHAAVGRSTDRAFHSYGLSHRAHQALCAVDEGGPGGARPKDVAEQLGVARAAATTFIQRLDGEGFVGTTPDPGGGPWGGGELNRRGLVTLRAARQRRPRPAP